eukprot:11261762-Karenia_brevis.AAC.1
MTRFPTCLANCEHVNTKGRGLVSALPPKGPRPRTVPDPHSLLSPDPPRGHANEIDDRDPNHQRKTQA